MPARKVSAPVPRARVVEHHAEDQAGTERMLDQLTDAAGRAQPVPRSARVVDLVVGANRVITNLGRRAQGCTLTPTVADATFAWSFEAAGDKAAVITVVGVAQPACPLEFY